MADSAKQDSPQGNNETRKSVLRKAQAGDEEAWSLIDELYSDMVRRWCVKLGVFDAHDVAEIRQEVLLVALAKLKTFEREREGSFRKWLKNVTRNVFLRYRQEKMNQPQAKGGTDAKAELEAHYVETEEEADVNVEENMLYRKCVDYVKDNSSGRDYEIFCRVAIQGQAPAEITEEFGMTTGAIRAVIGRFRKKLKEEFGDLL